LRSKIPGLVFSALCFIWGSTWLAIKVGLESLPPFLFAAVRFAVAAAALLFLMKLLHSRLPRDSSSWVVMLFLGVFQISLPYGLVFWGEQYISSGLAAVLFATLPFFVVIFAHVLVKGERLTGVKVVGVIASFAGLVAIFWGDIVVSQTLGAQNSLYGSLAVVGGASSCGLANVVGKRYAARIDPAANVLVQALTGTVFLSLVGIATERGSVLSFTLSAVFAVLYLAIVGSALAFVGLYWLLTKTTATNASLLAFITPIFALILGWGFLGEIPDLNVGLGTALILGGVYLTVKPADRLF